MTIPGLPEGTELVRIGRAKPDEFEITTLYEQTWITKGLRHESMTQVVVRPAEGYAFIGAKEDHAPAASYVAVKLFDPPIEIVSREMRFRVANSLERYCVNCALDALRDLPGFVQE